MVWPFLCVIGFVLVTNILVLLRWTDEADLPRHPSSLLWWNSQSLSAGSFRRRLRFPADSAADSILSVTSNFSGITPRTFERRTVPCFPAENRWFSQHVLNSETTTGFLFNKPFKTGSSTAVGVHLRIAQNLAKKQFASLDVGPNSTIPGLDYSMCQTRFDHGFARDLYPRRDKQKSFLWTTLRDPTKRAISMFFHFMVARHKVEPTDANFQAAIETGAVMARDYYLSILSASGYTSRLHDDPIITAQAILDDEYDFIGITERMDESLVALQLLLGLSTADILYLSAKHNGNFDDGAGKKRCFYIWPSFVTSNMQAYFASDHWRDMIQWDLALYQAANRSLDLTIEKIGMSVFQSAMRKFKEALAVAQARCRGRAVFPCSEGGAWRPNNETNCIWNDSGCGNDCLDEVADELGLWANENVALTL